MAIDLTKPFKRGRLTHLGLVPPGDPMFSGGPMIAGIPLTEWLGVDPKKKAPASSSEKRPTKKGSQGKQSKG